ncbi:MAG: thiamine pyrophosphate-binding protein [Campylobacter sp.]|nr:thiamine pyrophosphate-binding protein [Campylobacter sp.]
MALDTKKFINALIDKGYTHICAVPCSFAKYVINEAINNAKIEYLPCASEAVACSVAAGLKMAGAKPLVIVQSSGVTNMGSCITSLLKPYDIKFPILTSWRTYKQGDSEIQHKHLATELIKLISAYGYDNFILDNENLDIALSQIQSANDKQIIGIIKKDSFEKVLLDEKHVLDLSKYEKRSKFLTILNDMFKNSNTLFIGTTGNTAREMYTFMKDTKNFYMVGNMGGALSLGLGASKAGREVIVCGGDAEFVMHMGGLSTAGRYKNDVNLTYILFDNEANKSTGGQKTYQEHVDYIAIARACGFEVIDKTISNEIEFKNIMSELSQQNGLKFMHVKCAFDDETPRPPVEVVGVNKFE